jgi:hypothetical protein
MWGSFSNNFRGLEIVLYKSDGASIKHASNYMYPKENAYNMLTLVHNYSRILPDKYDEKSIKKESKFITS